MVARVLSALCFGAAALMLVMLVALVTMTLGGRLHVCDGGGLICRDGLGALLLGLILLTGATASVTIGLWLRSNG